MRCSGEQLVSRFRDFGDDRIDWSLRLLHLAQHLLQRLGGQMRVEAFEWCAKAHGQQYLIVAAALRRRAVRGDVRSVEHSVAEPGKPFERSVLDPAFGETSYQATTLSGSKTNLARSRRSIS